MLRAAVCVSGGGTNLQAIIDAAAAGTITNTELALVISNKPGVYALERAKKAGISSCQNAFMHLKSIISGTAVRWNQRWMNIYDTAFKRFYKILRQNHKIPS